jgi:hypothetical protein
MSKLRSVKEAAEKLNQAVSTLNHWRVSGFGPQFVKLGRSVAYRDEDLDAFIAHNLRKSTSEVAA